mmetsp:Transcript_177880/g.564446  ORF Transcript_177880/g.564446 Transcript_177880/m.564446 type:complete len:251 (-) Transcript_177880:205-957(-)
MQSGPIVLERRRRRRGQPQQHLAQRRLEQVHLQCARAERHGHGMRQQRGGSRAWVFFLVRASGGPAADAGAEQEGREQGRRQASGQGLPLHVVAWSPSGRPGPSFGRHRQRRQGTDEEQNGERDVGYNAEQSRPCLGEAARPRVCDSRGRPSSEGEVGELRGRPKPDEHDLIPSKPPPPPSHQQELGTNGRQPDGEAHEEQAAAILARDGDQQTPSHERVDQPRGNDGINVPRWQIGTARRRLHPTLNEK